MIARLTLQRVDLRVVERVALLLALLRQPKGHHVHAGGREEARAIQQLVLHHLIRRQGARLAHRLRVVDRLEHKRHEDVVLQVLAHGQLRDLLDARRFQDRLGAEARKLKDLGRADCAAADDHLLVAEDRRAVAACAQTSAQS